MVIADPGFGKTTLLADFSSRFQGRCLWYRLDETDSDWITMVNYVIAAVRETGVDFGRTTATLLNPITGAPPSKDAVLASLMHELQALSDQPTTLVLDDLHSVDDGAGATELISRLLRDAPPSFSFVLATRRRPKLALARWSAMADVVELSTDDLRFSAVETERLFAEVFRQPLEPDALRELELRTKGWAATLQLFHSLIRGRTRHGVRAVVRSLSGATGPIYDYLAEEVLGSMPARLHDFVVRASILDSIVPAYVAVLDCGAQDGAEARRLIEETETLGILARASQSSQDRRFHPLLREFLLRKLTERVGAADLAAMHGRIAREAERHDVLTACHHYIEAGEHDAAIRCLGSSVIHTLGSGRSGAAAQLIDRLKGMPADPAVVAIQARRLMEEGDIESATALLDGLEIGPLPPTVRAVIRHTRLSLGWRRGDSESMFETLREISEDHETPPILRDIAQIFVDASPMSRAPVTFPALAQRLRSMARTQAAEGHHFYAGVSLHNAAVAELLAGRVANSGSYALEALESYDRLGVVVPESYSTHALLALCSFEAARNAQAEEHIAIATGSSEETADVHAECAYAMVTLGQSQRAFAMLSAADALARAGKSDLPATMLASFARALLSLPTRPEFAVAALSRLPGQQPLDLGYTLERRLLTAVAYVAAGSFDQAEQVSMDALADAEQRSARRCEVRLRVVRALARQDSAGLAASVVDAAAVGELALLQLADVIGQNLQLIPSVPLTITDSIRRWPARWLPVLRRQLESGSRAAGAVAARLLDEFGTIEDVGRLRAYDRTHRKRGKSLGLGKALARRVSPSLIVSDLGRVQLRVADREISLTTGRRKPAALLMYLVTRPNFTATREQILEELWRESDPDSASNSLNQSLYFLRRDIDPWYEDGVSADYVVFESELLWLDSGLVRVASAEFLADSRRLMLTELSVSDVLEVLSRYTGMFSPEFEYEEWASSWRLRVHAAFLDFAHTGIRRAVERDDLTGARDIASAALARDPNAEEIEIELIRLYWNLGATSAAETQYEHLARSQRADGLDPPSLAELLGRPSSSSS